MSEDLKEKAQEPTGVVDFEAQTTTIDTPPEGTFWLRSRKWIRSVGAEEFGVERIRPEFRTDQNPRDLCSIFAAANFNTATLALGYLAPTTFGLGWWDSFLAILFFNVFGGFFASFMAMFGPRLGLRTMIVPRYSFGWWPAKVLAILNVINQLGWGIVNCISGAVVLYDVGYGHFPLTVAVLLVAIVAIVFGLLGYRMLHIYDRWSWIVMVIAFIVLAGFGGSHFVNIPMGSGSVEAANILSFGTSVIGFQVAWLPVAADYGVYMREDVGDKKSFGWAYVGLISSQLLMEWLGAAIGTLSQNPSAQFQDAASRGIGGLIGACFEGHGVGARGFGKFIQVILGFSTAAVVTTNVYSLGLSVQMISKNLLIIPRLVWSLLGSIVILACSMAGRDHLGDVMENFLLMCAYWIVPFAAVLIAEHYIWRRDFNYDVDAWNDRTQLPYGIAASVAWIISTVLSIISMSQEWWVGPIAAAIGGSPYGTDISWILALAASFIVYIPLRVWERRQWKY